MNKTRGSGIVWRLRAVSATIIVLLLLGIVSGGALVAGFEHLRTVTTDRLVPALALSSELQARFAQIYVLSDQATRNDRYTELRALDRRATKTFEGIGRTVEQLRELDVASLPLDRLTRAVDAIERDTRRTIGLARRAVEHRRALAATDRALASLREDFRILMDPAIDESTITLARRLEPVYDGLALEPIGQAAIGEEIATREALAELSHRITAILDLAATLIQHARQGSSASVRSPAQDRLRLELRYLPGAVVPLGDTPSRDSIGPVVAALNDLIADETGLFVRLDTLQVGTATLERESAALLDEVAALSTVIDTIVAGVESAKNGATATFDRAASVLLITVSVAGALIIDTVLLCGYVVVERQIGHRMSRLTETVLEIASGETDVPIDVDGRDEIGEIARALYVFEENSRELRRSNEELERFAYAAAHDMRTPLRSIESLAQWTLEDEHDVLSEDGRDNLRMLLGRAQRLSNLQTDLLDYAQAGEIDGSLVDVDVGELVGELGALIDPDGHFRISVDGAPLRVRTHATPLRQIVLNLLNNAIKHHDRASGSLVVGVRQRNSRLIVTVSDDGPGIEPQYHERIFALFTTLKSKDEVEGSGLGLSMVHKLVERYGGRISVDSDPGSARGTTFAFDLPSERCADGPTLAKAA